MPVGMTTAYDLTAGIVVNIDELVYMVSAIDSPLITGVDSDGLSLVGSEGGLDQIQFTWMHDGILTPRSSIAAAVTADTVVTLQTTGDRLKFSTGDFVRVSNAGVEEFVRVTGYGTTAETLLITRGFDGTTARSWAAGSKFIGLGTALSEGSDPEQARTLDRSLYTNNTQIFGPTAVHMSRTQQKIKRYGVADEWSHQLMGRMQENVIAREQAALYGRAYNSTASKVRTTGGIFQYVTTNVNTTATQLTVVAITAGLQLAYNRGGSIKTLMANPVALATLNDPENTTIVRTTQADTRRGRASVQVVTTEFGDVTIARNRWMEPTDAVAFNREAATRRVLDPLQAERLAKTGDSDKMHIVCEEGWEWKGQEHMVAWRGLGYGNNAY